MPEVDNTYFRRDFLRLTASMLVGLVVGDMIPLEQLALKESPCEAIVLFNGGEEQSFPTIQEALDCLYTQQGTATAVGALVVTQTWTGRFYPSLKEIH